MDGSKNEIVIGDFFGWADYKTNTLYRLVDRLPYPHGPTYVIQWMTNYCDNYSMGSDTLYNLHGYKKITPTEKEMAAWSVLIMKS